MAGLEPWTRNDSQDLFFDAAERYVNKRTVHAHRHVPGVSQRLLALLTPQIGLTGSSKMSHRRKEKIRGWGYQKEQITIDIFFFVCCVSAKS